MHGECDMVEAAFECWLEGDHAGYLRWQKEYLDCGLSIVDFNREFKKLQDEARVTIISQVH